MRRTGVGGSEGRGERSDLDAVLEAYIASDAGPNRVTLAEWVKLYPHYERELTEFTVTWSLLNWLPEVESAETIDHETLVMYGMSEVQRVFFQRTQKQEASKRPLPTAEHSASHESVPFIDVKSSLLSLLAEGKRVGLTPTDMAVSLGFSVALLRKLDRRLLLPATIPAVVTENVARTLGRDPKQIAAYLQHSPQFRKRHAIPR